MLSKEMSAVVPSELKLVTTLGRFQGLLTDRYQLRTALDDVKGILETSSVTRTAIKQAVARIDRAILAAEQEDLNQLAVPDEH